MKWWRYMKQGVVAIFVATFFVGAIAPAATAQNPNNFTIEHFEADYYLGRNQENASTLKVEEKITAVFPDFDQNRGIERALPKNYDGHTLNLAIESVKNADDHDIPYATRNSRGNEVLRIGDANKYVHGEQTYKITYTYENVTKNFEDHDEFYWDTNGTQWQQMFGSLVARVHLDTALAERFDNRTACYVGVQGSDEACSVERIEGLEDKTVTFAFTAGRGLQPGENVSMVIGFQKDTFAAYQLPTWEKIQQQAIAAAPATASAWWGAAIVVVIIVGVILHRQNKPKESKPKGKGTVVPEYLPPKDASVLLSAQIAKGPRHAITAQIMDFAVRHYIKIYEIESKKLFKTKSFELEITKNPDDLREGERELFDLIFSGIRTVGTRVKLDDIARQKYTQMQALSKNMKKRAKEQGYRYVDKKRQKRYRVIGWITVGIGLLGINPVFFVAGIVVLVLAEQQQLTQKGIDLKEYLEGLKMYMKFTEAERLRVLQGPDTAEKVNVDDTRQLVKLYERILPYAILFGVEKEWGKQFTQISDQAPDWYVGSSPTFNAAMFVTSVNTFTTATSNSFSPSSNSSSSGFSGGGGYSGGGGGGGGGGGW